MKHRRGARDWNMRSSYTKLALHTVFLKQFSHTIIIKINAARKLSPIANVCQNFETPMEVKICNRHRFCAATLDCKRADNREEFSFTSADSIDTTNSTITHLHFCRSKECDSLRSEIHACAGTAPRSLHPVTTDSKSGLPNISN